MDEDLHLLRQQALRTLPSPQKRTIAPSLLPRVPTTRPLESDRRINELMFRDKIEQSRRKQLSTPELSRPNIDNFSSRPKVRRTSSPYGRKRPRQARPLVRVKRRKRSSSGSSSRSAYSSSSQSRSASRSSYSSSHSSSPSNSRSSRSSSQSSHSRSLSSRQSSSYSRSSFSSSSRSASPSPKPRSKKAIVRRNLNVRTHRSLDSKSSPGAKRLRSPTLISTKSWHAGSLEHNEGKLREDDARRRRIPQDEFAIEHSYRNSRRSRSPPRLGDKFVEHSQRPGHYIRESPRCHHPSHSPSRERRIIRQVRRSPPPIDNDRYSRRRMRPTYSPPPLRHRAKYSPPPPLRKHSPPPPLRKHSPPPPLRKHSPPPPLRKHSPPPPLRKHSPPPPLRKHSPPPPLRKHSPLLRRRPRMHSLERPRRPIERRSPGREERYKRLSDSKQRSGRRDEIIRYGDGYRNLSKDSRLLNSHSSSKGSMTSRHPGRSTSDTDQDLKKRNEEKVEVVKRDRTKNSGDTKNGVCKTEELELEEKEELTTKEHLLQTQLETSGDLLGDYEFDVELDYDENMDELEVHSTESPKAENDDKDSVTESDNLQQAASPSVTAESRSTTPETTEHKYSPIREEDNMGVEGEKISSPIRVSPDRERDPTRRGRESSSKTSNDRKLSIKDRLYVSRQTIEEKRRAATKGEAQSSLRPSLASRLGPSPQSRRRGDDFPKSHCVTSSRLLNKSSKGDAVAIAEAYRRKKRQEAIGLHKDEVQKAKKFTKIINEHGSNKTSRRRHVLEDVENDGDKEKALDKRINEIKEQNRAIMKRNREIEEDKELYG